MEKELTEIFEAVKKAADVAENSPGEEDRCLDALKQLKDFPINYQLLVSTQVGKRLRQLTKHKSNKIKALASDVVEMWKGVIVKETTKNKNGNINNNHNSAKDKTAANAESTTEQNKDTNLRKSNPERSIKPESSSTPKVEAKKPISDHIAPPKLTSLVYCKDPLRDKVRELLAEALSKVSDEIDDDLKEDANSCDPYRISVLVETIMFEKWGKSNGPHKFKYRSVMFNIKDQHNPDFRRKVLLGEIEPNTITDLTPEEMASDERQFQNEKIKEKALFNSEVAGPPKASTDQFTCGRCKKKETTYYQLQTRSADEPMTTFVSCVNCGKRWKF